jgi:hypothetical protein
VAENRFDMQTRPRRPRTPRLVRKLSHWSRIAGDVLRSEGVGRLFARAGAVIRGLVYREIVVTVLDLKQPLRSVPSVEGLSMRFLRPEDVEAYARFRGTSVEASPLRGRLGKGHRGSSAWLEGEIVSAGWVATERGWFADIGRAVRLAPYEVLGYDSYTAEPFRGRSIAAARAVWSGEQLRDEGFRRIVGWVSPQNRPGFGPPRKAGFRFLGRAGFVRIGQLRRDFVQPEGGRRRWARRREPIEIERDFGSVLSGDPMRDAVAIALPGERSAGSA